MKNTTELGRQGEETAASFLKKHGYKILDRNFRTRFGEIDIVARKDRTVCFIEVKTRTSMRFGLAAEAVTARKQEKILLAARQYLLESGASEEQYRFDVIEVYMGEQTKIHYIQDAFGE